MLAIQVNLAFLSHYWNDCSQKMAILQLIFVFAQSHKSDIPDEGPIYMLCIQLKDLQWWDKH